ncbi:MAG: hypothetical protein K5767_06060 [Clostridia bacterium]|nr:hypothetical protein [Clostridia bacterium]
MRDYWNNVPDPDPEELAGKIIKIIEKAGRLNYSQAQNLRNASELCDRSLFGFTVREIAAQVGEEVPAELDAMLENPEFDERLAFINAVVKAVDPAPVQARAKAH